MDRVLMTLALIMTSQSAAAAAGEHRVTCTTEPIQAEEGDDITFRCRLDPLVNLLHHNFDVSRADSNNVVVHAYRDGGDLVDPQTSWYRDRTSLDHEDLQRGIITLNISSLQLKDSGQYRLFIPDLEVHHDLYLHVAEKGRRHQTRTRTESPRTRETPDAEPQGKQHVGAVVGGVVGGVLLLGVIIGVLVKINFPACYTPVPQNPQV